MRLPCSTGLALLGAVTAVEAISTIKAYGNKFFYENGTQFFIKGIAYQLTGSDPLIDAGQCTRDAALMQELGANAIRVYHVDPSAKHTDCMTTFAKAGIYLFVDLDTFDSAILPETPYWNETQLASFSAVMDEFVKYDNTLGFFVGNEVIDQEGQSQAAPYIKAAARDLKAYRASKNYREIPVGYSAADIAELRPMLQDYLTCGGNTSDNVDFFSLNSYEWCGTNTYQGSGYANLEQMSANFPVPIFFSETGCNQQGLRSFDDQAAIFGDDMVDDWSGAIVYEWIQEGNSYGLVSYGPTATAAGDPFPRSGTPLPVTPDFGNLKAQWATLTPTGIQSSAFDVASLSTRACPTSSASGWLVDGDVPLPTVGQTLIAQNTLSASSATSTGTGTATSTAAATATNSKSPATKTRVTEMGIGLVSVLVLFMMWM